MLRDSFGSKVQAASTRWIEPPWKVVLSNRGILPLLGKCSPITRTCCPPISRRTPPQAASAVPMFASRLFARRGQHRTGQRWNGAGRTAGSLWQRRVRASGLRAAAKLRGPVSGGRELDRRRPRLRAVDPRGHQSDHGQHLRFLPHAILLKRGVISGRRNNLLRAGGGLGRRHAWHQGRRAGTI